jgi:osmoprotectant transport system substrate-binding protein
MRARALLALSLAAAAVAAPGAAPGAQQPAAAVRLVARADCLTHPSCGVGLRRVYGVDVRSVFVPLTSPEAGIAALDAAEGEVALALSPDPQLARPDLVALRDDRRMVEPVRVTPVVRAAVLRRLGRRAAALRRRLEAVGAALTTAAMRRLHQHADDGRLAEAVGGEFVEASGFERPRRAAGGRAIRVGYQAFEENEILAHLYAEALRTAGFRARVVPVGGLRARSLAALRRRAVDLVAEYSSALRETLGGDDLRRALARRGLVPLRAAPADLRMMFVTTRETAARLGLRRMSDLRRYWPVVGRGSAGSGASTASARSAK